MANKKKVWGETRKTRYCRKTKTVRTDWQLTNHYKVRQDLAVKDQMASGSHIRLDQTVWSSSSSLSSVEISSWSSASSHIRRDQTDWSSSSSFSSVEISSWSSASSGSLYSSLNQYRCIAVTRLSQRCLRSSYDYTHQLCDKHLAMQAAGKQFATFRKSDDVLRAFSFSL